MGNFIQSLTRAFLPMVALVAAFAAGIVAADWSRTGVGIRLGFFGTLIGSSLGVIGAVSVQGILRRWNRNDEYALLEDAVADLSASSVGLGLAYQTADLDTRRKAMTDYLEAADLFLFALERHSPTLRDARLYKAVRAAQTQLVGAKSMIEGESHLLATAQPSQAVMEINTTNLEVAFSIVSQQVRILKTALRKAKARG